MCLREARDFRKTSVYKVFQQEYEEATELYTRTITEMGVGNVSDFFAREQAMGALSQVTIAKKWFDTLELALGKIIEDENQE